MTAEIRLFPVFIVVRFICVNEINFISAVEFHNESMKMAGLPADLFERFQDYLNNEQELREVEYFIVNFTQINCEVRRFAIL